MVGAWVQTAAEMLEGMCCSASSRAWGPGLQDPVSRLPGLALSNSIIKPILEQLPHPRGGGAGGWAAAPALGGRLHKPSFSGKAAKNSHGRCAAGCMLPVPGLVYIAAALGLGPRPRAVPGGEGWASGGHGAGELRASHRSWAGATGDARCSAPLRSKPRSPLGASPDPMGPPPPRPAPRAAGEHR